jgi:hypothetical protein
MSLLVRKINLAKWKQVDLDKTDDVSADAITNCLKTTGNTLSVWHIETEADLDSAILAIVANQDHLDKIDVVFLDEPTLTKYNLKIVANKGRTAVESLNDTHRDIAELNYTKLGQVKDQIVHCLRNSKHKRYTVNTLKKILNDAIEKGLIQKENLKESLRKDI